MSLEKLLTRAALGFSLAFGALHCGPDHPNGNPDAGVCCTTPNPDSGSPDAGNPDAGSATNHCLTRTPPTLTLTTTLPRTPHTTTYEGTAGTAYTFTTCASTGDITRHFYDFGDGTSSTTCNNEHTFSPGTYTITAGVSDDQCQRTDEHTLTATITPALEGKIAFVSKRDGNEEIYTMNADGTNQTRLTNNTAHDLSPQYSPDGTKIVYVSAPEWDIATWEIYTMNIDGSNPTRLTNNQNRDFDPVWSPDGVKIAFAAKRDGEYGIYTMNIDGSNSIRITNSSEYLDREPSWSPDGNKLLFVRESPFQNNTMEIYVMNANGTNQTRLTSNAYEDSGPVWNPDGTKIAFTSERDGNFEIYVMNADGTNEIRITEQASGPVWNPDGTKIAFTSERDGNFEIYVMNADGTNPVRLTNNPAGDFVWSWTR